MEIALRSGVASFALGLMVFSNQAFAQAAPPATAVPDSTGVASGDAADNEIVVTGSRIARPDLNSPSPVNVVTAQDIALKAASTNIENVLNDLPQVTPTTTSTSNNPGGGVATANLRGLGPQRTLVLVNGRRYLSFDVSQQVDLNTVPSALIERVDVETGGASSVYGSDAIAGVVNFILKHNFSGVELNSSYDVTQRGDGQIWDINGTIGSNFDDNRGNVTMYVDYTKRKPTFAGDRGFSKFALTDPRSGGDFTIGGSGSVTQGRINVPGLGAALGQSGAGCGNPDLQTFNQTGDLHCYTAADSYNYAPTNYLQVPQERFLVSMQAQYEINEHFQPYMEAQFSNNRVTTQLAPTPIGAGAFLYAFDPSGLIPQLQLQVDSPFFSAATQAALRGLDTDGDGYVTTSGWTYRTAQVGPRANTDERNAFRVVTGMKGDIVGGFTYDGYYMYSRTKNSQRQTGNVAIDKFLNAVTTKFDADGNLVCANDTATAGGCTPADIFGAGKLTQANVDYFSVGATNLEQYVTQVASFAVTNSNLFDFGAGGVGIAFGAEYRSEHGSVEPDTFLSSQDVAGFNSANPTAGGYHVREFFGEIHVPVLHDQIIHSLEFDGAARQTKYSNSPGNVFTWSAGAHLAPIRDLTFRADYQKAIRGPSVSELFLGQTVSFAGNNDGCSTTEAVAAGPLHDICVAQFTQAGANLANIGKAFIQDDSNPATTLGGNPDLREESARTYTLGAVLQPSFLPRFSLQVDYYHINVKNLIHNVSFDVIDKECFENFNTAFCGTNFLRRDASGSVVQYNGLATNTGSLLNTGVDITAGYSYPFGNMLGLGEGKLGFSYSGTRLIHNVINQISGDPTTTTECAGKFGVTCGVPTPKYRHTFRTTLGVGSTSLSVQWRYLGRVRDDNPNITFRDETLKSMNYFDLTAEFDATDNFTLNLGVSNVFDKKPLLAASAQSPNNGNGEQSNTYPTFYDVLGRSFFVSGKVKF